MKKLYKINQFTAAEWDSIEYDWNEHEDEIVIIEQKNAYCMDITANGKRIVPILRKIEEAMTAAGLAGDTGIYAGWFGEWGRALTDRRDRKYFIWSYSGQSDLERGCWSYSWGIEQIDEDRWYIFLNIAKPQEETEETETAAPSAPSANEETTTEAAEEQTTETTETEEEEEENTMMQEWRIAESKTGFHAQKMVEEVVYESARFDTKQEAETYINTKINQEIAEEAMEEAQEWIKEAKEKEEQTMKPEYKHIYVEEARRQLEARADRSAWDKAVTEDAIDLLDTVTDHCEQVTRKFAET